MRQGKWILGTQFVEICEVDADSPFPILLLHHYYIGQLFWILYFPYEPGVEQVLDFFVDDLVPIWGEFPSLLPDGWILGIYLSLCMMISGSIPGISSLDKAK